jgi:hypothetical protein
MRASSLAALKRLTRITLATALVLTALRIDTAFAASSWNPTVLVNTEAFQVIDAGDGNTNIELKFGNTLDARLFYDITNNRFNFTKSVFIQGSLTATGSITTKGTLSGENLTVSGVSSHSGAALFKTTVTVKGTLSGQTLRVTGNADVHGALSVTGSIRTDSNITINDDADSNDAVLTFGNASGNKTLMFSNANQRFEFNKDLKVQGSLSGSSLTVDGNVTLHGVTYSAPTTQGNSNTYLRNDGAGNLTWTTTSIGNGSGSIISLHPEYANSVYFSSGSTIVGQLTASGSAVLNENFYHWTSSRAALQDYWISVRVRLPDNFSSWDPVKPIELRYRTADGTTTNNHVTVRMKDTSNALVNLTNGGNLANASFTTANITGPQAAGTFAPKGYITIYIKMAALTGKYADVGFLNLNFETTTP